MKTDYLVRANRLIRRKNYDAAIKLLEPEVNRFQNSFTYYYLLAVSYLYSGVYGMAYTYFGLARKTKMRDVPTLLGLAFIYLHHGDTDRAVDAYLEILDIDEKNPIAHKALKIIRNNPGPENISAWMETGRFKILFPPFPKLSVNWKKIIIFLTIPVVLYLITAFIIIPFFNKPLRMDLSEFALLREEETAPMEFEGSFRYILTREQVISNYNEARRLFGAYNDEAARVRLNRVLESNAPEPIKNRARMLMTYLDTPGFHNLKDRFTYSEVMADPFLYRGCAVIWRGTVSNLNIGQNHTYFDLLVGYDTGRVVEGIVHVVFNSAIPINPEFPLELLGTVAPIVSDSRVDIWLSGIAINQAGLVNQVLGGR